MTYILVHPTLFSVYPIFSPLPNRSCFPLSTIVIIMIGTTLHHHASAVSVQFRIITYIIYIMYINTIVLDKSAPALCSNCRFARGPSTDSFSAAPCHDHCSAHCCLKTSCTMARSAKMFRKVTCN